MSDPALKKISDELEVSLARNAQENTRLLALGGILALLITGYLAWITVEVNRLMRPKPIGEVIAGMALEVEPEITGHIRELVIDGAPDIARSTSNALVDLIPEYRRILEVEMRPVVDEVCAVLAQTAVSRMIETGDTSGIGQSIALQAGADRAVARLDRVLEEALDAPSENDGPTPRNVIETTLEHLVVVHRGLERLARGHGDPQERELVMAWLNVLAQYGEAQTLEEMDAYRAQSRAKNEARLRARAKARVEERRRAKVRKATPNTAATTLPGSTTISTQPKPKPKAKENTSAPTPSPWGEAPETPATPSGEEGG